MAVRKGDIKLCICQKNDERALIIETADAAIENIIGYEAQELVGRDIRDILLPMVNEIILTQFHFKEDGDDIATIIGRIRDFGFVTKLGYEVKLSMKINRTITDDDHARFEIIIKDHSEISEGSKSALRNFRGRQVIDANTGLPDKKSFMKEGEFINFCVSKDRIKASFALISIDGFSNFKEQYGEEITKEIVADLVARCRINFREDDILGAIDDNIIGVILLEAPAAIAKNPLNRLRWQIASRPFIIKGGEQASITLSIVYTEITKKSLVEESINNCQKKLKELLSSGGNKIAEI